MVDDTFSSFERLSGAGGSRMERPGRAGRQRLSAWARPGQLGLGLRRAIWLDDPLVAYFRLKVNDNTSGAEIASFTIAGGGQTYGPLSLRGSDFTAAGAYQEFALPFTFNDNPNNSFADLQLRA